MLNGKVFLNFVFLARKGREKFVQKGEIQEKVILYSDAKNILQIFKKHFTNLWFYGTMHFGCADNRKERIRRERIKRLFADLTHRPFG